MSARRQAVFCLVLLCAFYAACALRLAAVHLPFCDEGWLASPGWNLIRHGTMETSGIEPAGSYLKGIDHYTYWIAPVYPLSLAGWYAIFGFGALQMRSFSVLCGVAALIWLFVLVGRLSASRFAALLAVTLTAVALPFVSSGSAGRMDMEAAAFGLAGLALYATLRETRFRTAVFASQSLLALSILSHPNGLILVAVLAFMTLRLDWRKLRAGDIAFAAIPYIIGVGLWARYIAKGGFQVFLAQFGGNAAAGGRAMILHHPLRSVLLELSRRYGAAFGFHSSGIAGLQAIPLLAWVAGLVAAYLIPAIRRQASNCVLLAAPLVSAFSLLALDGVKRPIYLVYVIPLLTVGLALCIEWLWRERPSWRAPAGIACGALLTLQVGGLAASMRNDAYSREYLPVIGWLRLHGAPSSLVIGPSELGFELGFTPRLVDDFRLGYNSGKRPDFIVINPNYRAEMDRIRAAYPEIGVYLDRTLSTEYRQVFSDDIYTIYRQVASGDGPVLSKSRLKAMPASPGSGD